MNDIRYEPVFGDQTLFDDGPDDAEMVAIYDLRLKRWYKLQDGECYLSTDKEQSWKRCRNGYPGFPFLAMRRIIPEPKRWTIEDQKAGCIPEVGAKCRQGHKEETVIAVTENFVVTECLDGAVCTTRKCEFMASYNPIETPEEMAARLREEWCIKALSSCSILSGMQKYELKRLGGYIEDIYDALLSGDLPVPVKEVK